MLIRKLINMLLKTQKKSAFSLVELLISLIVISCISAAFAPLITKKFSTQIIGRGGDSISDITADCEKFGPNCNLCTSNFCLSCTGLNCADNEYKDNATCTCKKCNKEYGEHCIECNSDKCSTCADGYYLDEKNKCSACNNKYSNCLSCNKEECTSCINGYVIKNSNCEPFSCSGDNFIQVGNLCITKKNMGDADELAIPNGINIVNTGSTCNSSNSNFCCWKGNTTNTCDNENGGTYSGCNRTVCDYYAADYICKNYNYGGYTWRLATTSEMSGWINSSIDLKANGLQLCDSTSGKLSALCANINNCSGSSDGKCYPYHIWNATSNYYLMNGKWSQGNDSNLSAFSTRCVTEMQKSCEAKFGAECLTCDENKCLACDNNDGYVLKNGKCESTFCKGSDFMLIGNLCITRRNMGDSTTLKIPSGINIVNTYTNCSATSTNLCCWKGSTAANCNNANGGGYSGCGRTACSWYAADYICKNYNYGGYTWRLPTTSEMANWGAYSNNKGAKGLQLCGQYYNGSIAAQCDPIATYACRGSFNGACSVYDIWSSEAYPIGNDVYVYRLENGNWYITNWKRPAAESARCVTEL